MGSKSLWEPEEGHLECRWEWQKGTAVGSESRSDPFRTKTDGQVKKAQERPFRLKEHRVPKPRADKNSAIPLRAHDKKTTMDQMLPTLPWTCAGQQVPSGGMATPVIKKQLSQRGSRVIRESLLAFTAKRDPNQGHLQRDSVLETGSGWAFVLL